MTYDIAFDFAYKIAFCCPYCTWDLPAVDDYLNMLDAGGPLDNKAAA